MWPRLFTSSFGFWKSGVAKNGDGVSADGILGSSSWMRKVKGLGGLVKRTLLEVGLGIAGVFLFRALDRLKVGVGEAGEELLIGVAGVLVTSGPEPPGIRLSAIVSTVDDVRSRPGCWSLPGP